MNGRRISSRLRLSWLRHREKIWALSPQPAWRLEGYYRDLILEEGKALDLKPESQVLFIGCGATPYTAVGLAREFACRVTAIDRDIVAVWLAHIYLKKRANGLNISLCWAEGTEASSAYFDVIMLALHAFPKDQILRRVLETGKGSLRIAIRDPKPNWSELYGETSPELTNEF